MIRPEDPDVHCLEVENERNHLFSQITNCINSTDCYTDEVHSELDPRTGHSSPESKQEKEETDKT